MPEDKQFSVRFVAGAAAVVGAWMTLIVGLVTMMPEQQSGDAFKAADASAFGRGDGGGLTLTGLANTGLAGPLAEHLTRRLAQQPTITHLRLRQSTGRGLFAGRGEPNARVVLLRGGRAMADTRANENGVWQIATTLSDIAGEHEFAVEQRMSDGFYVVGDSVRLHVPDDFRRTIDISPLKSPTGFQLVAVRADGDDIGSASSRKFDELLRDGQLDRQNDDRRDVAERSGDLLEPAWSWLRDANRSYHREIVPRIKRGGGYDGVDASDRGDERDTARRSQPDGERRDFRANRDNSDNWPGDGGSWGVTSGITNWLAAARRGYSSEIVPRLSGKVPSVIVARPREDDDLTETEAERLRRLERERTLEQAALEKAEAERREAQRRRLEAEERRRAAEAGAREIAEARRQSELEEARKIAQERRRVLERRAAQERQRAVEEKQRLAAAEDARRREAELAREQEAAEREALAKQRLADEAREQDEAERERKRLAELTLRQRENEREAQEERNEEAQRRRRLIEQAEAIRRRQAEARLRAREARKRQEELALAARRREAVDEAERQRRLAEQARADKLREAQELEEQRRRIAAAARERELANLRRPPDPVPLPRQRTLDWRTTQPSTDQRRRTAQQRLQDLNRFTRRDTEIEFTTSGGASENSESRPVRTTVATPRKKVATGRTRTLRRKVTQLRNRRGAVRGYRRKVASAGRRRCHPNAGRKVNLPGVYVVKRGDTLWKISKRHYRLGRYFRMIQKVNKIRRARLIYPCQRFRLPRRQANRVGRTAG